MPQARLGGQTLLSTKISQNMLIYIQPRTWRKRFSQKEPKGKSSVKQQALEETELSTTACKSDQEQDSIASGYASADVEP